MKNKTFYMFIGDNDNQLKNKSKRFVVLADTIKDTNQAQFIGVVVATNKKAAHSIGEESYNWGNPLYDMARGSYPPFVPVSSEFILANFDKSNLSKN